MPLDIFAKPLNLGVTWSNLRSKHPMPTSSSPLCFASMQALRWRHLPPPVSHWNFNQVLRRKPENHPAGDWNNKQNRLEKHIRYASSMILTHVTVILDHPITKSSCTSGQYGLLRMYSCLSMSQVSAIMISLSTILVPRSMPHVCSSPLLVHRHDTSLLDLLYVRRSSLCSIPAHWHSQETCCTHILTWWLVSKLNQSQPSLDNHS
jgi:hypothetical protein